MGGGATLPRFSFVPKVLSVQWGSPRERLINSEWWAIKALIMQSISYRVVLHARSGRGSIVLGSSGSPITKRSSVPWQPTECWTQWGSGEQDNEPGRVELMSARGGKQGRRVALPSISTDCRPSTCTSAGARRAFSATDISRNCRPQNTLRKPKACPFIYFLRKLAHFYWLAHNGWQNLMELANKIMSCLIPADPLHWLRCYSSLNGATYSK